MLRKTEGRRRRATEDEMVGWYHGFNGHELGQTPGDGRGQGGLACCCQGSHGVTWGHMGSQRVGHDLVTEQQQQQF